MECFQADTCYVLNLMGTEICLSKVKLLLARLYKDVTTRDSYFSSCPAVLNGICKVKDIPLCFLENMDSPGQSSLRCL
ncbi:hypothetical protein K469DRAFT_718116, partial [Zopfia rhizophila CBS 207.26]